ncbi:3-alpha--hydroxysteroid dehydrogenase [Neohortaea acidophila]|uniref:3-alpha--hydroxysteroid dehydrogenase n=1 Tax=Neohortaea acidophila TaxID=245834 RepID=A0A6A6PPU4_9PEZI|nr:3-alpha--hydroxysteroid dehydrogenase [Neohortaea acidophila]KAF2482042.1 3-alpha--hydroxysteroid dehydrogenase [Neohortaea acidophila]
MPSVSGKIIVLTGAASGIGRETARYLASQGAKVSIADIQEQALQKVAAEIEKAGGAIFTSVVDVRNRSQVEDWIRRTVDKFGKLDGAVNLAGVYGKQSGLANIEEIEDDDWDFVHAVNVKGLLNCLRAQIPEMRHGGSIVNASSVHGLQGSAKTAAYGASKHAVIGMTKSAAKELAPRGIRCNCICPGVIDTPLAARAAAALGARVDDFKGVAPLGRLGTPRDIAYHVEWLLSDGSSYITGTAQRNDGGWLDY